MSLDLMTLHDAPGQVAVPGEIALRAEVCR
jgi:hypothetical protein